jgi:hypothetical protein
MENNNNPFNQKLVYNINTISRKDHNNDRLENKSKLRKQAIHKILMKKTVVFVEEITNEKLSEIEHLNYDKQYEIIKSYLISNNEPNIIKILSYIIKNICNLTSVNRNKLKILDNKILDDILLIFYTTNNKDIFSLCSSILSTFCTDYYVFSLCMINEEGIKRIYNELQNKYFNNPYIISNCINCYKEGLNHLIELINSKDFKNQENLRDISYGSKRLLCNLTNWVLYNKEIFYSIPQEGMQSFFKLIELLITTVSVPEQYEMNFDLNGSNTIHFENLIFYPLSIPLKDIEYETFENYLPLLVLISKEEKYLSFLTKKYNNISIFDVMKRLFGYIYLNNDSTDEDRINNPSLDSLFIYYCLIIIANLIKEAINNDDITNLILLNFKKYRSSVQFTEEVPNGIMTVLLKISENLEGNQKMADFIFCSKNNIINDCIKFYVRNNKCYELVMQFLLNIFEYKNYYKIENVNPDNIIQCFVNGLDSKDREICNKSIYCISKMIDIQNMKKYNIDLILKYEEYNVVEKLNSLLLNTDIINISEEEKVEYLIKYIETKIKEQDK